MLIVSSFLFLVFCYPLPLGPYPTYFSSLISLQQIHTLIMSLNYIRIEIKTAHSLKSWNGGVLVMVTGTVHVKDFIGRKKFVQTFFLAPQDKGFLVVNDIFHFVDEEQSLHHPVAYIGQVNLDAKPNTISTTQDQGTT